MSLSPEEINRVAMQARIDLDEDEKIAFAQQLTEVLNYAERLNELDTTGVEPLIHILPVFNIMRRDEALPSSSREEILSNAPAVEDGQYIVPRII